MSTPPHRTYRIPCYWEERGVLTVHASHLSDALAEARSGEQFPRSSYVEGSFTIQTDQLDVHNHDLSEAEEVYLRDLQDPRSVARALARQLADAGGTSEALDEGVHALHARTASNLNNQGLEAQVAFLLAAGLPPDQIRALVDA